MNTRVGLLVIVYCLVSTTGLNAQHAYRTGLLPAFNINKGLKNDWGLNFKLEGRQLWQEGLFGAEANKIGRYAQTDVALVTSRKVGLNNTIAGGFLVRFRDGKVYNRLLQQFAIVRKYSSFRMGYRFAADQTFASGESAEVRLRYRMTTEIPLNGTTADAREFYFKLNNEYLNSLEASTYDLEIRFVPLVGYKFTDNNKTEIGLDYRINAFLANRPKSSFWLSLSWYIKL